MTISDADLTILWGRASGKCSNPNPDSDSFNEGCEEYSNQLDTYDECISSKQ